MTKAAERTIRCTSMALLAVICLSSFGSEGTPIAVDGASPDARAGLSMALPPLGEMRSAGERRWVGDEISYASVSHHAGARPAPPTAKRSMRGVAHYTGFDSWEPTLGITSEGHIFTPHSIDVCCGLNDVLRSRDGGKTWEAASPKLPNGDNSHLVSADPYIYVDELTDRIFTVDLTLACSSLSFSDDGGDSWTMNPFACGQPMNDHQTLFGGPPAASATNGYPNVLYYCFNHLVAASTFCSKSLDGGVTFEPTGLSPYGRVDLASTDGVPFVCGGTTGHGVVGEDGTVYLPRVDCGQPWLAFSRDEGLTWERTQVATNGGQGHEAGVAVDRDGNLYMIWTSDEDNLPYLALSRDGARTWSEPLMVGAPGVKQGVLPGIAVGDPGRIAIVYMGTEAADGAFWNGYVATSTSVLRPNPVFHSVRIGTSLDPLSVGACLHRCDDLGDFFDVVIGPDGKAWAALVDGCIGCGDMNGKEQGVMVEMVGGPSLRLK